MRGALLGLAAVTAIVSISPAQGQSAAASSFSASSGFRNIRFTSPPVEIGPGRYLPTQGRGRHIRVGDGGGFAYGYGGGGYYDSGDFDANRSFSEDHWNDWWHDRPDRAFPRWVWHNQNCSEDRMWSSGSGWRCTP
jgi:hypothetical protein